MGEVVIADNTVTGAGVVLAQRLEQLAQPGGVCIQGAAYETVPQRFPFDFESLGEQTLKGIEQPVRAFTVSLRPGEHVPEPYATSIAASQTPNGSAPEQPALELPDKPSIVVLPFINMSGDPEQEYFADGITEDIITELSRFRSIAVIARTSAFAFKGKAVPVQEIGKELGVAYVLEGSVRKAGDRVRITAQLVETGSGNHVWAERYDRALSDIFAVQDEVTTLIVGTISGRVNAAEAQKLAWKPPEDMTAYDRLLRGLQEFNHEGPEGHANASRLFQEAITIAPGYARAHAHLAFVSFVDVWYAYTGREMLNRALEVSQKALALDVDDTFAQAVHGFILFGLGRDDEGISTMERSIELNPNDAEVLHWSGFILIYAGRASEGTDYIRRAIRLNPFSGYYDTALGLSLCLSGQFEEAVGVLRKYLGTTARWSICFLAVAYGHLGRKEEARSAAECFVALRKRELQKRGVPVPVSTLALADDKLEGNWFRRGEDKELIRDGLRKAGLT